MADEEISLREMEYLVAVFECSKQKGYARQFEIRAELKVAKPTASLMMKKLAKKGYIKLAKNKVMLAEKGEKFIREIIWKHGVIEHALVELGIPEEKACAITWKIAQKIPLEAVKCIWENLGMPNRCPCGYELPEIDGHSDLRSYEVCLTFKKTPRRSP